LSRLEIPTAVVMYWDTLEPIYFLIGRLTGSDRV